MNSATLDGDITTEGILSTTYGSTLAVASHCEGAFLHGEDIAFAILAATDTSSILTTVSSNSTIVYSNNSTTRITSTTDACSILATIGSDGATMNLDVTIDIDTVLVACTSATTTYTSATTSTISIQRTTIYRDMTNATTTLVDILGIRGIATATANTSSQLATSSSDFTTILDVVSATLTVLAIACTTTNTCGILSASSCDFTFIYSNLTAGFVHVHRLVACHAARADTSTTLSTCSRDVNTMHDELTHHTLFPSTDGRAAVVTLIGNYLTELSRVGSRGIDG